MPKDIELLNDICKNTEMGCEGIRCVLKHAENEKLKEALQNQYREYRSINQEAAGLLEQWGTEPERIGAAAKVSSEISAMMGSMSQEPDSKIAEMMMEGSTKGIIKITKQLRAYGGDDREIKNVANRLLSTEKSNLEQMKQFL